MRRYTLCIALCAATGVLFAPLAGAQEEPAGSQPAGTEQPETAPIPAAPAIKLPPPTKNEAALDQYNRALEAIKRGNEAQVNNNSDDAYCAYDEAVMVLNGIKGKYPAWEREKVIQQIKNVLDVKEKLVAVVCKDHEEMKQGRFRFLVWQRQVSILSKLDLIMQKLEEIERDVEKNQDDIRDVRDVLTGSR